MPWIDVWTRKAASVSSLRLADLIAADGFDTGAGIIAEDGWRELVDYAEKKIGATPGERILEVGCGAGAFLLPLYEKGYIVSGIDYSAGHVEICRKVMPRGDFRCHEALELPFSSDTFSGVFCHSVMQYFPDMSYARRAVQEMLRVLTPGGKILLLDINDQAKKLEFEAIRLGKLGREEYERMYAGLPRLYYDRAWFHTLAPAREVEVNVFDRVMEGYENSQYRYNVILVKFDSRGRSN